MITITREKRKVDEDTFLKFKKYEPFATYRQKQKAVSFGFIFLRSSLSFALADLAINWSLKEAEDYIKDNNLQEAFEKSKDSLEELTDDQRKFFVCSDIIRTRFFETYPGLKKRADDRFKEATNQGFIRSMTGGVRHLPELFLSGKDDKKLYGKLMTNLKNIASNATIQGFESSLMKRAIANIILFIKENNLKSRVFGDVHDSIDCYLHKAELDLMCSKIHYELTKAYIEYRGYPLDCEIKVADPVKGEIYKSGKVWKKIK